MPLFKEEQKKAEKGSQNERIVSFLISEKEYAVNIRFINEIIYSKAVNPLPGTSEYIEGIIDLRGKVIPLINLKKRLKLPLNESVVSEHVLVVDVHQRKFGLIVDRVLQVITVEENEIQMTENFMDRSVPYLQGVCRFKDRLILLLDLEHFWTESDLSEMESTLNGRTPTEGLSSLQGKRDE
jgi:purine-binding chemotaxis protein CheW